MANRVVLIAFGHTNLLQRVGGGELLDSNGLQAVLPSLLPGVLAALVDTLNEPCGRCREGPSSRQTSEVTVKVGSC